MARTKVFLLWGLLVGAAAVIMGLNGCGGSASNSTPPPPPPPQKIQHIVIIFQENRSPDNLFQDPVLIQKGADIQNYGVNSHGTKIPLWKQTLHTNYSPFHSHSSFLDMCDLDAVTNQCKMDGADLIPIECNPQAQNCPPPNAQFTYVDPTEAAPYFQMAEQYTFADAMFETNQGPSFPAHQFMLAGTSAPSPTSNLFAAENPVGKGINEPGLDTGCTAPPQETVALIDPATGDESQNMFPCYDHPTLTDLLTANKNSWRYYAPSAGSLWTAPNAISHICVASGSTCTGSDWNNNVVLTYTQVLTDIQAGNLADVTWVIPSGQASDHPAQNNGSGPSWVASVVNAIGGSKFWPNTAIFITWDDWGGFYDHVKPFAMRNQYEYGFRVPLIVVSPYAKAAYISHVNHHFGSILKYIEENFGLPAVGAGIGNEYADVYSDTDDLSDCFDYNQAPLTFQTIKAPLNAKHFLEDKQPPTDPDDD